MTTKPIKVYDLFLTARGWSPNTKDYSGVAVAVAAVSIRQAYYCAGNRVWADFGAARPTGVLHIYRRDRGGHELACGCSGHPTGLHVGHMAGIRALRAAIALHLKACPLALTDSG